ncbi:MAG: site-2 protease family protein [Desulfohalobiaceae bacterium]|nr:site-2 protease family protein [Desulfohalobiaceae bacterium]
MFDISTFIQQFAILAIPVLSAITFHEVAHGYAAYLLGDPTAKDAGRLTLNPIKHLDPLGALALFIVKVGWAKPVPINPGYFKNPRKGLILVSLAGPGTNFALAVLMALCFHLLSWIFVQVAGPTSLYIFRPLALIFLYGVVINIGLGVFNLLPVPPLDGSNILAGLLPPDLSRTFLKNSKYGFILLIFLFLTGAIHKIVIPVIVTLGSLLIPDLYQYI